jgi:purine-binding chemotaxis protein CheW
MVTTTAEPGRKSSPVPSTDHTAREIPDKTGRHMTLQIVEFMLGKERYAIDLFDVREVVEYTSITRLPDTPACIKGIIDLRGEITTIIDLKGRLNIAGQTDVLDKTSRIIVLDEKITKTRTGILVDDVLAVSTFERGDIDATSASLSQDEPAILGIIKKTNREKEQNRPGLIIWIDIRHLLKNITGC